MNQYCVSCRREICDQLHRNTVLKRILSVVHESGIVKTFSHFVIRDNKSIIGLVRDLNPGPLAPKARIIPLDQRASYDKRI